MTESIAELLRRVPLPIRTPRLELCAPASRRDRELVRLLEDPSVARWTVIPFPYGATDAAEFRQRARGQRRRGTDLPLQIVRRSDGALVGGVGLHRLSEFRRTGELGYWVGAPFRRQGYASEAARSLVRVGFASLRLHRVEAHVFPGNTASERVLAGLDFRREGRLRESQPSPRGFRDELLYARLAADAPRASRRRSASPGRTK